MLSIGAMAGGQEAYYADLAREDYYLAGGEPPGTWWTSRGAAGLGVYGKVERDALTNVFRGYSPDGERALVRNAGRAERRAGFDLTFSAPKSVSVLLSQAPAGIRARIQAIHARAVERALGYLEDKAAFTRRGAGGEELVRASLVVALFEHSTARATAGNFPDPHLHTHCLVMNVATAEDGSTGTLDGRHLYRHKMAAGALYRAELFASLEQELGLLATKQGRIAELDIIPERLRTEFSKRRQEILTYLEERGLAGASAAADAALETRGGKPVVNRANLFEEWRARGEALGFTLGSERLATAKIPKRNVYSITNGAIEAALARITERESHFGEKDLVRFVAEEVEGRGVGALAVRLAVEEHLRCSTEIVPLAEVAGEKRFTTKEMLELEKAMLDGARELANTRHAVHAETLKAALAQRPTIRDEQREALLHVTSGGSFALVSGMAGTGKTFMLAAAREAWEAEGFTVRGAALSAAAAKRLEAGSRIASTTIHRTLSEIEAGRVRLGPEAVLVVDEAGMVGTRQMAKLVEAAKSAGAKLVLVGDERQLQAIDAGGPFASMIETFGAARLTEIRRQKDGWARDAVSQIARGDARQALAEFKERGLFFVGGDRREAVEQLVEDWTRLVQSSGLEETLVLTGTRLEAAQVNRAIQSVRWERGELGAGVQVGKENIHVGDRILFRRNSKLVSNGDGGVVTRVSRQDRTLTAKLDGGKRVTVDLDAYSHIQLGYSATTHVAQGATLANCLVLVGGSTQDREAAYVQASRATDETRLYTDTATAGAELADLVREMERSRRKGLALELAEQELSLELADA